MASSAAILSLTGGIVAILLPHLLMVAAAIRSAPHVAFSLWAGKFFVSILLLAAVARGLSEAEMLASEYFMGGVAAAVLFNMAMLMYRRRGI